MGNNELEDDLQIDDNRRKHDADSRNDGSTNEMLQQEKLIDQGNEHYHHFDDKKFENDMLSSPKFDADAGGDTTGPVGHDPGEGEDEEVDSSGEEG
jgi:hypothetical protein